MCSLVTETSPNNAVESSQLCNLVWPHDETQARRAKYVWKEQKILFECHSTSNLWFIPQLKNGPCGLLSPLTAFTLRHLSWPVFGRDNEKNSTLEKDTPVELAAADAVVDMLFRAATAPSYATLASHDASADAGCPIILKIALENEYDLQATDKDLQLFEFATSVEEEAQGRVSAARSAVRDLFARHGTFARPSSKREEGAACVRMSAAALLYSMVLTRGLARVSKELEGQAALAGGWRPPRAQSLVEGAGEGGTAPAGFCSDALISLCLMGRATNGFGEDAWTDYENNEVSARSSKGCATTTNDNTDSDESSTALKHAHCGPAPGGGEDGLAPGGGEDGLAPGGGEDGLAPGTGRRGAATSATSECFTGSSSTAAAAPLKTRDGRTDQTPEGPGNESANLSPSSLPSPRVDQEGSREGGGHRRCFPAPLVKVGLFSNEGHDPSSPWLRRPDRPVWVCLRGGHCTLLLSCPRRQSQEEEEEARSQACPSPAPTPRQDGAAQTPNTTSSFSSSSSPLRAWSPADDSASSPPPPLYIFYSVDGFDRGGREVVRLGPVTLVPAGGFGCGGGVGEAAAAAAAAAEAAEVARRAAEDALEVVDLIMERVVDVVDPLPPSTPTPAATPPSQPNAPVPPAAVPASAGVDSALSREQKPLEHQSQQAQQQQHQRQQRREFYIICRPSGSLEGTRGSLPPLGLRWYCRSCWLHGRYAYNDPPPPLAPQQPAGRVADGAEEPSGPGRAAPTTASTPAHPTSTATTLTTTTVTTSATTVCTTTEAENAHPTAKEADQEPPPPQPPSKEECSCKECGLAAADAGWGHWVGEDVAPRELVAAWDRRRNSPPWLRMLRMRWPQAAVVR